MGLRKVMRWISARRRAVMSTRVSSGACSAPIRRTITRLRAALGDLLKNSARRT